MDLFELFKVEDKALARESAHDRETFLASAKKMLSCHKMAMTVLDRD